MLNAIKKDFNITKFNLEQERGNHITFWPMLGYWLWMWVVIISVFILGHMIQFLMKSYDFIKSTLRSNNNG